MHGCVGACACACVHACVGGWVCVLCARKHACARVCGWERCTEGVFIVDACRKGIFKVSP